jgi:hypothetical protein
MSALTTFLSGIACLLSIRALMAADANFKCSRKCMNHLQLMDCKYEVNPTWNCVFENKFMTKLIKS